jgi:hypothetical protein
LDPKLTGSILAVGNGFLRVIKESTAYLPSEGK